MDVTLRVCDLDVTLTRFKGMFRDGNGRCAKYPIIIVEVECLSLEAFSDRKIRPKRHHA